MKVIDIHIVNGAEGPALLILGETGGKRVSGPKAWGNPFNKPTYTFIVDANEIIQVIND